jgi:hypothetical protein
LREKESPAIDSATIESDPRALKEEYELAGLSHLGRGITAVTSSPEVNKRKKYRSGLAS